MIIARKIFLVLKVLLK